MNRLLKILQSSTWPDSFNRNNKTIFYKLHFKAGFNIETNKKVKVETDISASRKRILYLNGTFPAT